MTYANLDLSPTARTLSLVAAAPNASLARVATSPGDLGIISFAGSPTARSPFTNDTAAVVFRLDTSFSVMAIGVRPGATRDTLRYSPPKSTPITAARAAESALATRARNSARRPTREIIFPSNGDAPSPMEPREPGDDARSCDWAGTQDGRAIFRQSGRGDGGARETRETDEMNTRDDTRVTEAERRCADDEDRRMRCERPGSGRRERARGDRRDGRRRRRDAAWR